MKWVYVTERNYSEFFNKTIETEFGPMLLPQQWQPTLWGILCYENDSIVAGWVGQKRIKNKALGLFYQEIAFESQPLFFCDAIDELEFLDKVCAMAKKNGISTLCVSHWSRGRMKLEEKCATFVINLNEDDLFSLVESKQRNIVRKGEKTGVQCKMVSSKSEMMSFLDDFQRLRQDTQHRAIENNSKASMLLKSKLFFENIFKNYNVCLGVAEYEGVVASVALAMMSGKTLYYYSGGSDIEMNRKSGASALLVWKMIEYAKNNGYKYFDMGGVPVNPDESHPAYGVYKFKKSYGGEYMEFTCGDIVLSRFKHKIVRLAKNNRKLLRIVSSRI